MCYLCPVNVKEFHSVSYCQWRPAALIKHCCICLFYFLITAIIFCPVSNSKQTRIQSTLQKHHPSLLFTDNSFSGFKIVCSNLAVTAMRLVEDWETNSGCHLCACLSVCLRPGLDGDVPHSWQVSIQQSASSADLKWALVCVWETKMWQRAVCMWQFGLVQCLCHMSGRLSWS